MTQETSAVPTLFEQIPSKMLFPCSRPILEASFDPNSWTVTALRPKAHKVVQRDSRSERGSAQNRKAGKDPGALTSVETPISCQRSTSAARAASDWPAYLTASLPSRRCAGRRRDEWWSRVRGIEFHAGELFPRVDFIVTNLETDSRAVVRFYNKGGTAEVAALRLRSGP